jgi:hypothetical protein
MSLETITKYMQVAGFETQNITDELKSTDPISVLNWYEKFAKIALEKPKVVFYFKRNSQTEIFFKLYSSEQKLYFINKDNFITMQDKKDNPGKSGLTPGDQKVLSAFLTDASSLCAFCLKVNEFGVHCEKCAVSICRTCAAKHIKKFSVGLSYCPQCLALLKAEV